MLQASRSSAGSQILQGYCGARREADRKIPPLGVAVDTHQSSHHHASQRTAGRCYRPGILDGKLGSDQSKRGLCAETEPEPLACSISSISTCTSGLRRSSGTQLISSFFFRSWYRAHSWPEGGATARCRLSI